MITPATNTAKGLVLLAGLLATCATLIFAFRVLPLQAGGATPPERGAAGQAQSARSATLPASAGATDAARQKLLPPADTVMSLTVPVLARVKDVPVKTAPGTDKGPLHDGALHVAGTGFPWQTGSNTYIAGHRLGFPGTKSNLLFWDLDELKTGDKVVLRDSEGREYDYHVFRQKVVGPDDISITDPIPGKSVVSLQTCTLPNYEKRLVVQAELVDGPHPPAPRRDRIPVPRSVPPLTEEPIPLASFRLEHLRRIPTLSIAQPSLILRA